MDKIQQGLSDYIHASKYAKYIPDLHRRETFKETVLRVKRMHKKKYPEMSKEIDKAFKLVLDKKILPSMRSMQFAGEPIFERNERMYNCSFTLIDRPEVFGQILYLLLCGVGVGFSVQKQHVEKLPKLKGIDKKLVCHHTIKDTIEGWADAVTALINSYINGYYIEFNYNKIRPIGSSLKSGGKAPGHLDLKEALESTRIILSYAENRQLKPIECHDIICHLSKAVLAGGIRRSSLISLFSKDDMEMMSCKAPNFFDFEGTNSQRALCNNSVVFDPNTCIKDDLAFIIELNKKGFGDPGFIFLEDKDTGINPCGEIGINPVWVEEKEIEKVPLDRWAINPKYEKQIKKQTGFGFCNLVEINAAACRNETDFYNACQYASFIATLQAGYINFPYLGEITENIVKRDALIGVSITGIMDAQFNIFDENILHQGAIEVKRTNELTAKKIDINSAVRCTCIKPSGTSSLELGGVSCGIHPHIAKTYFKRITANPLEPVAKFFKKFNSHMVETKPNGDLCITFPISTNGLIQENLIALDFLYKIYSIYENWVLPTNNKSTITHNVSCTITVEDFEWKDVYNCIWENRNKIRCMTFLPSKAYKQIPYMPNEPINLDIFNQRNRWELSTKYYQEVDYELMEEYEDSTLRGAACDGEKCGLEDRTFIEGNGYRVFEGHINDYDESENDLRCINEIWFKQDDLMWKFIEQRNGYFIAKRV